jgi:malonyl-CoA/methylmalonyl-CoA synthetase
LQQTRAEHSGPEASLANLYSLFEERWSASWDTPALIVPGAGAFSFREIDTLSARFAAILSRRGVAQGARVVTQVEKSVGAVALYLACLRLGAVFVPLNPAYTEKEVTYFLDDAEPAVFICQRAACFEGGEADTPRIEVLGACPREGLWAEALGMPPLEAVASCADEDLAAIVYTSGTTGRSKGAMLTHGNLASNALALHHLWGFAPGDTALHALPIYHVHGLFVALHTSFLNATPQIFLEKFDVDEVRRALPAASVLMGVPTFYSRLLDAGIGSDECAHMRLFVSGSAPLPASVFAAWAQRTGHLILERYGMTETGMIASNPLEGARLGGTVGYPLPDVRVRIADEAGREVPRGEAGVIEVAGPNVFKGYWGMAEKTAEEFRADGFFITGDVGVMSADGRISIVGRAKDIIIAGGLNIYPKEVEDVLDAVPGVLESAVVGVPHQEMGEGAVAVLVPGKPGELVPDAALQAALDARLARFKHPRRFFWVGALPRNAMGKVQKAALRERFAGVYL